MESISFIWPMYMTLQLKPLTEWDRRAVSHDFKMYTIIQIYVLSIPQHLSQYREPTHRNCNLRYKIPSHIPIVLHNLRGYDANLFIWELGKETNKIGVIAENKEKYISFTIDAMVDEYKDKGKTKEKKIQLRFINSFRFMASSLDSLTNNLEVHQLYKSMP